MKYKLHHLEPAKKEPSEALVRIAVSGGWIYRATTYYSGHVATALTFVADPKVEIEEDAG